MVAELSYSLHGRYKAIAIAWTIIIIPPTFLNLGLIYGLWYFTSLDRVLVLTIPTTLLGIGTALSILERMLKLCSQSPTHRPINSPRHALDPFMWGYFLSLVLLSAEISYSLIVPPAPKLSLIAMPVPSLLFLLGTILLLSLVLNKLGAKAPFRLGSTGKGEKEVRPAVFYVVEDIVAVDGNGGLNFRSKWNERYEESVVFKNMIWNLSWVWMVVFYVTATALTVLIWVLGAKGEREQMIALGVGWAGPFLVGGGLAAGTVGYVKRCLRVERKGEEEGERRALLRNEN